MQLNELQRRIVAALQLDGRLPWRRISEVLGVPERTVARQGTALLDDGVVSVAAIRHHNHELVLAAEAAIGMDRTVCEMFARRNDVTYSYITTGSATVVAELGYDGDLGELLTRDLPATPGLMGFTAHPVLKYFKTIKGWTTDALTATEKAALTPATGTDLTEWTIHEERAPHDDELITALQEDGRMSLERIARRVNLSETSVSRRLAYLQGSGQFSIRALVEPVFVGYPVQALLWVQTPPGNIEPLGLVMQKWAEVRYIACLAGTHQLLIDVTTRTHASLFEMLSHPIWSEHSAQVHPQYLVAAHKRGGQVAPTPLPPSRAPRRRAP